MRWRDPNARSLADIILGSEHAEPWEVQEMRRHMPDMDLDAQDAANQLIAYALDVKRQLDAVPPPLVTFVRVNSRVPVKLQLAWLLFRREVLGALRS